jgi:predicted dehydrogenase
MPQGSSFRPIRTLSASPLPDDRHFAGAKAALEAGKHVIVEKPSVLSLHELDELVALAEKNEVLAKIVYHKLLDPDHKKLRTLVADGELSHVNNGYLHAA